MRRLVQVCIIRILAIAAISMLSCSIACADLLLYWSMNDGTGTTIDDQSVNNLNGTLNGAGSGWTSGKSGIIGDYAIDLPGTVGAYASAGENSVLNMPGDFSVSIWAKGPSSTGDYSGWRRIVDVTASDSPDNAGITITTHGNGDVNSGYLRASTSPYFPVELVNNATTVFNDTSWYHIVMVRSGSSITSYVNGKPEGTGGYSTLSFNGEAGLFVGALGSYVSFMEGFQGAIDDFAIWNQALTPTQITALYNGSASPLTIPEPNMIIMSTCGLIGFLAYAWRSRR